MPLNPGTFGVGRVRLQGEALVNSQTDAALRAGNLDTPTPPLPNRLNAGRTNQIESVRINDAKVTAVNTPQVQETQAVIVGVRENISSLEAQKAQAESAKAQYQKTASEQEYSDNSSYYTSKAAVEQAKINAINDSLNVAKQQLKNADSAKSYINSSAYVGNLTDAQSGLTQLKSGLLSMQEYQDYINQTAAAKENSLEAARSYASKATRVSAALGELKNLTGSASPTQTLTTEQVALLSPQSSQVLQLRAVKPTNQNNATLNLVKNLDSQVTKFVYQMPNGLIATNVTTMSPTRNSTITRLPSNEELRNALSIASNAQKEPFKTNLSINNLIPKTDTAITEFLKEQDRGLNAKQLRGRDLTTLEAAKSVLAPALLSAYGYVKGAILLPKNLLSGGYKYGYTASKEGVLPATKSTLTNIASNVQESGSNFGYTLQTNPLKATGQVIGNIGAGEGIGRLSEVLSPAISKVLAKTDVINPYALKSSDVFFQEANRGVVPGQIAPKVPGVGDVRLKFTPSQFATPSTQLSELSGEQKILAQVSPGKAPFKFSPLTGESTFTVAEQPGTSILRKFTGGVERGYFLAPAEIGTDIAQAYSYYGGLQAAKRASIFDLLSGEEVKIGSSTPTVTFYNEKLSKVAEGLLTKPFTNEEITSILKDLNKVRNAEIEGLTSNDAERLLDRYGGVKGLALHRRLAEQLNKPGQIVPGVGALSGLRSEYEAIGSIGTKFARTPTTLRGKVGQIIGKGDYFIRLPSGEKFEVLFGKKVLPTGASDSVLKNTFGSIDKNLFEGKYYGSSASELSTDPKSLQLGDYSGSVSKLFSTYKSFTSPSYLSGISEKSNVFGTSNLSGFSSRSVTSSASGFSGVSDTSVSKLVSGVSGISNASNFSGFSSPINTSGSSASGGGSYTGGFGAPTPSFKPFESKREEKKRYKQYQSPSYAVFLGRGKKERLFASGLPKNLAFQRLETGLLTTLKRSGRVVRTNSYTDLPDTGFRTPSPVIFRPYRVSRGQKVPLPFGSYIQRSGINTNIEKQLLKEAKGYKSPFASRKRR